jgi:hypothetical protein
VESGCCGDEVRAGMDLRKNIKNKLQAELRIAIGINQKNNNLTGFIWWGKIKPVPLHRNFIY